MVLVTNNDDPSLDGDPIWTNSFSPRLAIGEERDTRSGGSADVRAPESFDPAAQFPGFKMWLLSYQPGFTDLASEIQESRAREYFDQLQLTGRLPSLPTETPGFMMIQDKTQILRVIASPHPSVTQWLESLKNQLLRSFLSDPTHHPHEQSEQRLGRLVTGQCIDPQIKMYLSYMLTERYNFLLGIFRLVYSLYINNLKSSLRKMHIALQSTEKILKVVENILNQSHYIYMAIFSKEQLVDQLIRSLNPHIRQSRPTVIEKINLSIRHASQVHTLLERIKDNVDTFLMYPHLGVRRPTSDAVEAILRYQPECTVQIGGLHTAIHTDEEVIAANRRVATLNTLSSEELIELYVRVWVPDISRLFYKSITAAATYIIHPESLIETTHTIVCTRCTYIDVSYEEIDVSYEEIDGPNGRSFTITPRQ
jgi:hypothetical protein